MSKTTRATLALDKAAVPYTVQAYDYDPNAEQIGVHAAEAERLTGYHVGGISPFGQKRAVPTALDASATDKQRVFVNGGQRGLQIEVRPDDIVAVLKPIVAALTG